MSLCPVDQSPLILAVREGHSAFGCDDCKGLWLPKPFLDSLNYSWQFSGDAFIARLNAHPLTPCTRQCPGCKVALFASFAHNIEVDWCTACQGVWLDQGELYKILTHYKSERETTSEQDEWTPPGFEFIELAMYAIMKLF